MFDSQECLKAIPPTAVILLAGGQSTRLSAAIPKPFLQLCGKTILNYSLEVFYALPYVVEVCVVCPEAFRCYAMPPSAESRCTLSFAQPGARRQDSVCQGYLALTSAPTLVAIHDSARPLIDAGLITRTAWAATCRGAALCGVPVKSTIKRITKEHTVAATIPREELWEAQTPQIIAYSLLQKALQHPTNATTDVTDDVAWLENIGATVAMVMGSYSNLKITTAEDLLIAASLLSR